ncbi:MAG: glutathione S-transferase family protein [Cyanobacteria bacterium J083]|nr:MAG: glutathione S-transferase family protein [Cyanobacteria bacterium J083]
MSKPAIKSLPATYLVKLGKFVWTSMWRVMMSQLAPPDSRGAYIRPPSQFRQRISQEPEAEYPPAANRYCLYVGMGCPWAHRTLVVRALKGLEDVIEVRLVYPSAEQGIWILAQPSPEGLTTLPQIYQLAKPGYQGRCTVPVLWDKVSKTIVNNESAEIIEILNSEFNQFATNADLDLYPETLKPDIDKWNEKIYHTVNNGVYRCGFAQTQTAYEQACSELFNTLAEIEVALEKQRYLCGPKITLADVRLFTTLFRFDIVYYSLFKCNIRRIQDYCFLSEYLRDIYQLPNVANTCDLETVKRDYYGNLFPLNPGGIIPLGPQLDLSLPHQRDKFN